MRSNDSAYTGVVLQVIVAAQIGTIDYQTVVTDITVMSNVSVDHEHSVITDSRFVSKFVGPTIDGGAGAEDVGIAYADFSHSLSIISKVLRGSANDDVGEELVVRANNNIINNSYAVVQNTSGADLDLRSNDTKRTNRGVVGYLGSGINTSKRMDFRHFLQLPKYYGD